MNEQLISQIEELGLSNKEARVYIANLTLGPAGVQQIADTSGIKRVTTYVILESLVGLGLVSQTTKAKKTFFNAESPENLRRLLEKREQSLKEQKQQLDDLLPQLSSLKTLPKDIPSSKLYEGQDGVRSMIQHYVEQHTKDGRRDKIYGATNLDYLFKFFPEIEELNADPSRIENKLSSHLLYTSSRGPIFKKTDTARNRVSRFLPPDKYPFTCDLTITNTSVAFMALSGSKPIGITVDSAELTQGIRVLFDLAWEAAESYDQ